jgi:hypothetical protein
MSLNPSQPTTAKTDSRGSRRTLRDTNRRPSTRRLYDGVVASYLHDISGLGRSVRAPEHGDRLPASETTLPGSQSIPRG